VEGDDLMSFALARDILDLTLEHLFLVSLSMAIAAALAIPAGILLTRRTFLQRWVLGFANIMQTVPSLALFGFLIPLPFLGGIGKHTAIVALVLYALLPILRNTLTGILNVESGVRESGRRRLPRPLAAVGLVCSSSAAWHPSIRHCSWRARFQLP
jgi:osmoprotectant transport system permease protein